VCTPVTQALRRLRQEDHSLGWVVRHCQERRRRERKEIEWKSEFKKLQLTGWF
jgi:hypothetical protein